MPREPLAPGEWGKITTKQVAEGTWRARTLWRDRSSGNIHDVSARGKSVAAAEKALKAKIMNNSVRSASATSGSLQLTRTSKLSELAAVWFEEARLDEKRSAGTVENYQKVYDKHLNKQMGNLRINEIGPARVHDLLSAQIDVGNMSIPKNCKIMLRGMMKLAVRLELKDTNPVTDSIPVARPKADPKALNQSDLRDLLVAAHERDSRVKPGRRSAPLLNILLMLLATGARIGEVLALRWVDVNLDGAPTASITTTLTYTDESGVHRSPDGRKNRKTLVVVLPTFAVRMLVQMRAEANPDSLTPIFPNAEGGWIAPNNIRRSLRQVRQDAGLPDWVTPHTLRRTVATRLSEAIGDEAAAAQLGHSAGSGTAVVRMHYVQPQEISPDVSHVLEQFDPEQF